jgi:hypothetical protein
VRGIGPASLGVSSSSAPAGSSVGGGLSTPSVGGGPSSDMADGCPSAPLTFQTSQTGRGRVDTRTDCSNSRTELTKNQPSLPPSLPPSQINSQLPPDHQEMPDKKIEEKKAAIAEVRPPRPTPATAL